ncbi:MAG: DUF1566 domain-containing protein [Saccharospirillum sp.]|nr:DUF1566 domain-containing protein [Saccharospirillum sp.]
MNKLLLTSTLCTAALLLSACNSSSSNGEGDSDNNGSNQSDNGGSGGNGNGDSVGSGDTGGSGDNGNDSITPTPPTFSNNANLRATPLASSLLLEWDTLASTESTQLYYSSQVIDETNPAANGTMPPVNSCSESPCIIATPPGELTFIALLSENASGDTVDFSQILAASGQINDSGALRCFAPWVNPITGAVSALDITDCSSQTAIAGQDGLVGRDASAPTKLGAGSGGFDFTKLDSSGQPITDGSAHSCVRDNLTGLIWEVKTTSNRNERYVWGTNTGSALGSVNAHVATTNNAGLCGLSNWRLPTATELFGLVDFDKPYGVTVAASADSVIEQYLSIDVDYFPNTRLVNYSPNSTSSERVRHANYWTSDSYLNQYQDFGGTLVDFFRGSLVNTNSERANFVYSVNNFTDIQDGAFARLVSNGQDGVQP